MFQCKSQFFLLFKIRKQEIFLKETILSIITIMDELDDNDL